MLKTSTATQPPFARNRRVQLDYLGILFRWMHILAAITAVGGTIFMRTALVPSLTVMSEEQRKALTEAVRSRWVMPIMLSLTFLLVSGLYNIAMLEIRYNLGAIPYYRPLFGIKFLLALVIMFIASALVGRGKATERIRANSRFWLNLNMWLAIVLVMISGVLRMADKSPKPPKSDEPAAVKPAVLFPALPATTAPIMLDKSGSIAALAVDGARRAD